ncbi:multidrug effflux MFS transporter [Cellulomonas soli]|uniref:Bcr/CflA family drug resistance efflux transporter n=1 Tax=Cellulomonas soli TaxID=931535 RepID=A0A512PHW1_9CELL|nr:multidrug effflux MFS transporter [Cellulomonas soli]NYI59282.1 DHA1 family bicyclomycin/chloramphenicol resistance-like MFS transporter [Cellulomonas soli]GEP70787.1 Bcr/CflA family drug resistance efflux transporter [Cellulomonas soli]
MPTSAPLTSATPVVAPAVVTPVRTGGSAALIGTLALLTAIAPLATDLALPAFPATATDLSVSASAVQLTLTAFMIGLALGQLVIGPLSDQWGRRRPLLVGATVCVLASAACAVAPSVGLLVGARFVQGFAGAAGVVLARAVVTDVAAGERAAKVFNGLMIIQGVMPVVAPLLGGALAPQIGWRGIYWVVTGVSALMAAAAVLIVRESLPVEERHRGGLAGLGRDMASIVRDRAYLGNTIAVVFCFGAMFAYISASPFVLQTLLGLSTGTYSIVFAVNSIGIMAASIASTKLVDTVGPRRLTQVGAITMTSASALLVVDTVLLGTPLWPTLVLLFVAVASLGLVAGNATMLALAQVPHAAGSGSALLGASQFAIAALAAPLVGVAGERSAVPMAVVMLTSTLVMLGGLTLARRAAATGPVSEVGLP